MSSSSTASKKAKKDAHRHRNYRRKSRERSRDRQSSQPQMRDGSKDQHSSSNKRRDRSRSPRDRKTSASNRNRDRDPKDRRKDTERFKRRDEEVPKHYRREDGQQQRDKGRANGPSVSEMSSPPPPQPKVQTTVNPHPSDAPPKLSSIQLAAARAAALLPSSTSTTDASVDLPSYYNPAAINVAKYTSQIQKRKLLWSNKNAKPNADKWQQTAQFSKDEDGKVASKFMRLMGIKTAVGTDGAGEGSSAAAAEKKPNDIAKKQADMFSTMEQQYEIARQATHTMRGMGLGFSRQY